MFRWLWEWTQVEKHWPCETPKGAFNPRLTGGNIIDFKGSTFHRKSGYDLQKKITIIYKKKKLINITMLQPSRAKPGNPEL